MNFTDLAKQRYSLRAYSKQPVERAKIECCLEAARLAPSACNSQPWHFIVIETPALRTKLAEQAFGGIYRMNRFACEAPALVAMVRQRSKYVARLGGQLRGVPYSLIDIGIAGEHFALQAAEEGLGTCWLGWFNEKAVKKLLGLSRRDKIDILFSLGYPKNDITPSEKKRMPLTEMTDFR
jgi:nitroreductase